MKNRFTRIAAVLIAAVTAISYTPTLAYAAGARGDATEPATISAADDSTPAQTGIQVSAGSPTGRTVGGAQADGTDITEPTGYEKLTFRELTDEELEQLIKENTPQTTTASRRVRRSLAATIDWSKYSISRDVNPFYKKMDAHKQALYDAFTRQAKKIMNDSTNDYTAVIADFSDLSIDAAGEVAKIWMDTEAQYFFVGNGYHMSYSGTKADASGKISLDIMSAYQTGSARATAKGHFLANVNTLLEKASSKTSILEKEKLIHNELIRRLTWDGANSSDKQSSASSLIGDNTVCAGYAAAFSVLMNALGAPTISITSDSHVWNQIYLGGKWYNVDVTWDDPLINNQSNTNPELTDEAIETEISSNGHPMYLSYFNVSDSTMLDPTLSDSAPTSHKPKELWTTYGRPTCDSDTVVLEKKQPPAAIIDHGITTLDPSTVQKQDIETAKSNPGTIVTTVAVTDSGSQVKIQTVMTAAGNKVSAQTASEDGRQVSRVEVMIETPITDTNSKAQITLDASSMDAVRTLTEAAETTITVQAQTAEGTARVSLDSDDLDQKTLYMYARKASGSYVMVSHSAVATEDLTEGGLYVGTGDYELVDAKESKAIDRQIKAEVKTASKTLSVKKGSTKRIKLKKNESVAKVTYSVGNSKIARVSKKGNVRLLKKGKTTIKVTVTFKNGSKKTMKVTAKTK